MKDYCLSCNKRDTCKAICPALEAHLKNDIEVKRDYREATFTDLGIDTPENVFTDEESLYAGAIELTTKDWVAFVKKYNPTSHQKRCIYLRYWLNWTYQDIGRKYNTSRQAVEQTTKRFVARCRGLTKPL